MTINKTILVIDDSTTIRRLVDSTLSRDDYSVILAANAEDGLSFASEYHPDIILLDHQLPGTTGFDVCQQLAADPALRCIPVVISSTLRKKAYVEYADLANVVDMLPKPYTEDLLLTTVANALDTGSLVVESQLRGTAVPEVIDELIDSDLSGTFNEFSIREVLDFLNNGKKNGTLEVEGAQKRYSICLENGRVVGISSTGVMASEVVDRLPESLEELAPVLNVTMGRAGSALESIVELLNTEVLDPRLLRKLLRHQASVLLLNCFDDKLKSFRFDTRKRTPPLFQRLPLDISVLALLVEGASTCAPTEMPPATDSTKFTRQPIRGQNLDRAGLSARQSSILGQLTSTRSLADLINAVDGDEHEVRSVLYGLELAELVACETADALVMRRVVVFESDLSIANKVSEAFASSESYNVTVVNDATAARLLARRTSPDVLVVDTSNDKTFTELRTALTATSIKWIATSHEGIELEQADATLARPYTAIELLDAIDSVGVEQNAASPHRGDTDRPDATSERDLCTT